MKELPSWKQVKEAKRKVIKRGDKPIEINCFGVKENRFRIDKEKKILYCNHYPNKPEDYRNYSVVWILHDSGIFQGEWQPYPMVEYNDVCPVCLRPMLVRAIRGSTWIACCSNECFKKYEDIYICKKCDTYNCNEHKKEAI